MEIEDFRLKIEDWEVAEGTELTEGTRDDD